MRFEVGDSEGGGARSTAVTSGNYGIGEFVYARICVHGEVHSPFLLPLSRTVCTLGWLGAGNSLQLE